LTGATTIKIDTPAGPIDAALSIPDGQGPWPGVVVVHAAPARLRKVVEDKGITADIKVYPDVGQSFANQLPGQPLMRITGFGYNAAATEDAYRRVFAFFNEHLAS
jgi:dienelactone hydrolase